MTVAITRREYDAAALRRLASHEADAKVARRLLALALVLEGTSRADAASATGMDRQTLRDWVHRYNDSGVPGLLNHPHGGGPESKLSLAEKERLAEWVRRGPNLEEDGVVRWRLSDLKRRVLDRFFVILDERSIGRILKAMDFSHISVRPRHPKADAVAQETHKKTSRPLSPASSRPRRVIGRSNSGGRMKPGWASKAA